MKDQIASLLETEMDRKQFMQTVGVGAMLVLGGGAIMNALGHLVANKTQVQPKTANLTSYGHGYGASVYGGR